MLDWALYQAGIDRSIGASTNVFKYHEPSLQPCSMTVYNRFSRKFFDFTATIQKIDGRRTFWTHSYGRQLHLLYTPFAAN